MIRRLRPLAVPFLAAAAALFAGLARTLLRTGRVDPLDWLLPGCAALVVMLFAAAWGGRRPGWLRLSLYFALALLPALLLCALAAAVLPWPRMALLALLLATSAAVLGWSIGRRPMTRWIAAALCLLVAAAVGWGAHLLDGPLLLVKRSAPSTGVMTALPLFTHGAEGRDALDLGVRAPVLQAQVRAVVPVDVIDTASLASLDRLLLVQPRLLAPAELVALDGWVRQGGHAVILADPLLRWPAAGGLTDSRRPPITSLLDPLLTYWGLTLEPAQPMPGDSVERRLLAGGSLLQLAGASHFTLSPRSTCVPAEAGLFAFCRIGHGRAIFVADADWIDDALWTLDPARPRDARHWTSDAVPVLAHLLGGNPWPPQVRQSWLVSQDALISGLRWSLLLALLLSLPLIALGIIPTPAHGGTVPERERKTDSGGISQDSG